MTVSKEKTREIHRTGWLIGVLAIVLMGMPIVVKSFRLLPEPTQEEWESKKAERFRRKAEGMRKKADYYRQRAIKYENPSR
ncbi:MAG: hypothetical protein QF752_12380 [Planctomycetota bacterium]|jgi:hypothetical protein|nr:hypothetical protein [Planctomycetota bacterium]|tara:strand:- start:1063 stop:1305 length:243 start_codon:yes stop_codon:yes gene_type:complete